VNNTQVLVVPRQRLETFGVTRIAYRLLTEPMDAVNQVRVREGLIQAYRPEIVTPASMGESMLEGFAEEQAAKYMDWLKEHERDLLFLQYGFRIRKDQVQEHLVSDRLAAVTERVRTDMEKQGNPLGALLIGVDEPWEVCLLKLMVEVIRQSVPHNTRELRQDPSGIRHEVESSFRAAAHDHSQLGALADLLRHHNLFKEYEDRFFALVRQSQ